jgi:Ca-activated chloride channel family protein
VVGGEEIKTRRWVGSRLPRPVSAARARQLLRDELDEGDFWVEAVLESGDDGEPRLTLQLEPEALATELRLTLAALGGAQGVRVSHQPLDSAAAVDGMIQMTLPASLGAAEDEPLAVLVEEIAGDRRGATFASLRTVPAPSVAAAPAFESTANRVLRLLPPDSAMVLGPTVFRTLVDERAVTRVEFYLDGELSVTRASAPFSARLDLGPLPRTRRVLAVAFGSAGGELARDSVLVNGGSGLMEVHIAEPKAAESGNADAPLVGSVEVIAEIRVPDGARLDRVEFFWRDRLVATRYAPPFRERVEVEPSSPQGFVRVLARLADGTSGEDVVFLNSQGPSERLDIDLVELYTVVTDRQGRPVTDLPRDRFKLLEQGRPMEIATFGDAGDLPLTVGLAIDSSASMFVKLPRVQRSVREFVRGLESRRDRAFLVGFGSQPRLARSPTTDLPQVVQALDRLSPNGQTAIWEAVAFSLVQLQGVPGKKALIVYSDGADEDPEFSYRTCLRFARTVGAPVYFILSNNEIVRTGGKGLSVRGFLGRLRELTSEVGGRVYFTRVGDDLDAVYREISEELRSQYFIGYYSDQGDGREWRRLKVDVSGAGLSARTISGFFR